MPLRVDHLPLTPKSLWEAVQRLQRDVRELRADRSLDHSAIGGTSFTAQPDGSVLVGGSLTVTGNVVVDGSLTGSSSVAWINVKDVTYGARGDGVTDDTTAIQAAINAVGAGGGIVYFPPTTSGYLLNGAALNVTVAGTVLMGAGPGNTTLLIGPAFTGAAAVTIGAYQCEVRDLSINGANSTTTSNPAADAVQISGARRCKVTRVSFANVNGWAVEALATSASSTSNPVGTQLSLLVIRSCAGGLHFLGNTLQGYAVNSFISDVQIQAGGTTTGSFANLDGILIEDSWDVLINNVMSWISVGTGSALHIKGNCAASFLQNLDTLGPNTGPSILIEDGPNGSPQNVQVSGGVIQQGSVGVQISGGSNQIHLNTSRIINNQGHGVQVDGTATTVYLSELFFSLNGAAATGTNYDINWSGTAVGFITNCRFATSVVASGTAGVQNPVNIATAGQNVRVINASFQGSGATSANWFTNTPSAVFEMSNGSLNYRTGVNFLAPSGTSLAVTGGTNGQRLLGTTGQDTTSIAHGVGVSGESFDRARMTCDGSLAIGPGTATRDTVVGRSGIGVFSVTTGSFSVTTAGKGLAVKEGTNAKQGTAVLVGGTVTVANTSVTANSRILLTSQVDGGTPGFLRVSARVAGTSFTATSSSGTDTSTFAYQIFEPA